MLQFKVYRYEKYLYPSIVSSLNSIKKLHISYILNVFLLTGISFIDAQEHVKMTIELYRNVLYSSFHTSIMSQLNKFFDIDSFKDKIGR